MDQISKVQSIIIEALKEIGESRNEPELTQANPETILFGKNGCLDSISLVTLIADIEEVVSSEFDKEIIIADEKAFSQKNSPFKTVASLSDFVVLRLNETME